MLFGEAIEKSAFAFIFIASGYVYGPVEVELPSLGLIKLLLPLWKSIPLKSDSIPGVV